MKKLETKSCEEIMSTAYKPLEYCVDGLLTQGLYILAGAPKVGKSWLALDICLSVAKGEDVLKHRTHIGTALYLCLEDSYNRIQNRLYELTDEPADNLYFAIMSESLGNGLESQIEKFKFEHPDTKLIVIDTLQMVRNEKDCGYGADYKELSILKALADKLAVTILLVHHTRKCYDSDPFNMISGSTGISGCVDGSMVLTQYGIELRSEAEIYTHEFDNVNIVIIDHNQEKTEKHNYSDTDYEPIVIPIPQQTEITLPPETKPTTTKPAAADSGYEENDDGESQYEVTQTNPPPATTPPVVAVPSVDSNYGDSNYEAVSNYGSSEYEADSSYD